jgi:hypothetical protein
MIKSMLLGSKTRRKRPGASLILAQRKVDRFSDAQLDRAMQNAWHKDYDPQEFFSVAIPQEHGAVIHAFGTEIAVSHFDYPLDWSQLGEGTLPFWAQHEGFSVLDYKWDRDPDPTTRTRLYRGLCLLAAELASEDTAAFLFPAEQVLLPNSVAVSAAFRGKGPLNPLQLASLAEL